MIANQLSAQNNNLHEVAKNLGMSQNEILNVLQQNTQYVQNNYNFTPTLVNHNNVFQNLVQTFSMATPRDRSRSRDPEPQAEEVEMIPQAPTGTRRAISQETPQMVPSKKPKQSRAQSLEVIPQMDAAKQPRAISEEIPQLSRKPKKPKGDDIEVVPVMQPARSSKRPVSRETPAIPKRLAITDKPEEQEIIPQLQRGRSRSRMVDDETPQMTGAQRAVRLLTMAQAKRRNEMEMRQHLGNALMRAKARLASKEGETKLSIVRPRSVTDMVEQIEAKGMPTDLSPRLRKPFELNMDVFKSRPQVSFGPARRSRRSQ